jgi:membrane-associated protease RseP (regulator of RpoE activity)
LLAFAGVALFVLGVLGSIALHELGHLVSARRAGMLVSEFAVGFGPKVVGFTRGETRYVLRLVPLGGYCQIEGTTEGAAMPVGQEHRAFHAKGLGRRVLVLASGSLTHLVLAVLMLVGVLAGTGVPASSLTLASVDACQGGGTGCVSEARSAGLEVGDEVVAVGATSVSSWDEVGPLLAGPTSVSVLRGGATLTFPVEVAPGGVLGVVPAQVQERAGWASVPRALEQTGELLVSSVTGIATLPEGLLRTASSTLSGQERGPEDPVGLVGVARISGEVADATGGGLPALSVLLVLLASVNVFLAVLNILPVPPLDGGALAVNVFESVRHKLRQRRGYRGAVARVNPARLAGVVALGVTLVLVVNVVVLVADVVNPVSLL